MNKVNYISIPKGLASKIVHDKTQIKALSVYYQLKSLYVGGIILDYSKRRSEISAIFGYGKSKLSTYINVLKKMDLAETNNGNLVLKSKKILKDKFKVSKFNHKIKNETKYINNLEIIFKKLAIQENMDRQKHLLVKKLVESKLKEEGREKGYTDNSTIKKRIKKGVIKNLDSILVSEKKRFLNELTNVNRLIDGKMPKLNPFVTLSRMKVAKLLGCNSKSTGSRTIGKIKSIGLIDYDVRYNIQIPVEHVEYSNFLMDYNKSFYLYNNNIRFNISNEIIINQKECYPL